jgi:hypothetical protein
MHDALRQRICIHEAGHCAAALCFGLRILSVSVEPPRLLRQRLRPPAEAWLTVCFSGGAAERLHIGGGFNECGEIEDYRMAHRFLCRHYPLVEVGIRIDTAILTAESLVKTPWARARVPVIARALHERGTLSGDQINDLLLSPPPLIATGQGP